MNNPTITATRFDAPRGDLTQGTADFLIEGGEITGDWDLNGRPAFCRITISLDTGRITSYGGSVWTGAWPCLFAGGYLTNGGWAILAQQADAIAAADCPGRALRKRILRERLTDWAARHEGGDR